MKVVFILFWLAMTLCSAGLSAAQKNILLICVDDLRPELQCYGKDYIHSPNIDQLAKLGRLFEHHYVNSPSCGPSRYTLLTGRYGPSSNSALRVRARQLSQQDVTVHPSMPEWFRSNGYMTVSVGKVSHHPGGLGGKDWNDPANIEMPGAWDRSLMPVGPWQHPKGAMHGLANGEIRKRPKDMDVYQAVDGPDTIYPDGLITDEAITQLELLSRDADKPFLLAVGLIRPHLPFGAPKQYLDLYEGVQMPLVPHPQKPEVRTTWHRSSEFYKYNRWKRDPNKDAAFSEEVRRHYAACVSYADAQVGRILDALENTGAANNTIIILWGDHGWHLGEHAIWGKHCLFEEALHAPLIITFPGISKPGVSTKAVVETVNLFATLCELTGLEVPDFTHGTSLMPHLINPHAKGHTAYAYRGGSTTLRTETHRIIQHKDGFIELYDHRTPEAETKNVADKHPKLVSHLAALLAEKQQLH